MVSNSDVTSIPWGENDQVITINNSSNHLPIFSVIFSVKLCFQNKYLCD